MNMAKIAFALFASVLVTSLTLAAERATSDYVIYASRHSIRTAERLGDDLVERVNRWRQLLRDRGADVAVITQPDSLQKQPIGRILVLPANWTLSEQERGAILARVRSGGRVVVTSGLDIFGENGTIHEASILGQVVPVAPLSEQPMAASEFTVIVGNVLTGSSWQAGTRVWSGRSRMPLRVLEGAVVAAYKTNWARTSDGHPAIALGGKNGQRVAFIDWSEVDWGEKNPELRQMVSSTLDWVEGRPLAGVAQWPLHPLKGRPFNAAMTLGIGATWGYENLLRLEKGLPRDIHASFYLLRPEFEKQSALIVKLLAQGHEVGSAGDRFEALAGTGSAQQAGRIESAFKPILLTETGAEYRIKGIRLPFGASDTDTEQAVAANGGQYLVDVGRVDTLIPAIAASGPVVLPNRLNLEKQETVDSLSAALLAEARRLRRFGGYSLVGIDASALPERSSVELALSDFLAKNSDDIWIAPAAEVARWIQSVKDVKVEMTRELRGYRLQVIAPAGHSPPYPLVVLVDAEPGAGDLSLIPAAGATLLRCESTRYCLVLSGSLTDKQQYELRVAAPARSVLQ